MLRLKRLSIARRAELYDEAIQLHREKGWGCTKISRYLNVNPGTIYWWIQGNVNPWNIDYGIDSPTPLNLGSLSVEKRCELHDEALRLRNIKKWGSHRIGRYINVNHSTIDKWIHQQTNPANGYRIPNLSPSPELAYVIGVFYGDGSANKTKGGNYFVSLNAKDKDFVREFARCLGIICCRKPPPIWYNSDSLYVTTVSNRLLFEFLGKRGSIRNQDVIEKVPAEFLRGMFDSDGSASGRVGLYNSDLELIKYCRDLLHKHFRMSFKKVRINTRKGRKCVIRGRKTQTTKNNYCIQFQGYNDVLIFHDRIGFSVQRKQEMLNKLMKRQPV